MSEVRQASSLKTILILINLIFLKACLCTDNFIILHYNIDSILLQNFKDCCFDQKDWCFESKLDKTIPTNLITIPGYPEPIKHDREVNGRYGGGVYIYIADNLVF